MMQLTKKLPFIVAVSLVLSVMNLAIPANSAVTASTGLTLEANTPRTTASTTNVTATLVQSGTGTIGKDAVAFRIQPPTGANAYFSAFRQCTDATDNAGLCTDPLPTAQTTLENDGSATLAISYADAARADSAATATLTIPPSMLGAAGTYTIKAFFADADEADDPTKIDAAITANVNVFTESFVVNAAVAASYAGPYSFNAGTAITNLTLTPSGLITPITYAVTPTLPAGLALNTSTGVISGIPEVAQAATNYTVTVTGANSATGSIVLSIAVNAILTPASQTINGVNGTAITPTSAFSTAGFTGLISYTTLTALPAGLSINAQTGVISGTPTAISGSAAYTVLATDSLSRTATSTVTIAITGAAITPASQTLTAVAGTAITATTAFVPAGFVGAISYAILPALPAGLTMSTTTGVITGTPTANQAATVHTITATGATSGTATASITITVTARILPATQTLTASAGTAITPTTAFTAAGFTGTVVYTVAPPLPAGLSLNNATGVISGTATAFQTATTHTITATGTTTGSTVGSGTATATISISVGAAISPATREINLTQNLAMTPSAAYTLSGFSGTISYSINPALPAGLVMSTTTGIITGTPAVLVAPTNHTITVTGSVAGVATTVVTLAVYAPLTAPTGLSATAGDARATITWNPVAGATSYQVVSDPAGASCVVTSNQAVCTNLVNNTRYTFRVTAVNQVGPAALSTLSTGVTPRPPFVTNTAKITIFYAANSTVIPRAKLLELRAIATQFKADNGTEAVITVKGFTARTGSTAIEKNLAIQRARNAAKVLRDAGLKGKYTNTGDGLSRLGGAKARKVVINITYKAPS